MFNSIRITKQKLSGMWFPFQTQNFEVITKFPVISLSQNFSIKNNLNGWNRRHVIMNAMGMHFKVFGKLQIYYFGVLKENNLPHLHPFICLSDG